MDYNVGFAEARLCSVVVCGIFFSSENGLSRMDWSRRFGSGCTRCFGGQVRSFFDRAWRNSLRYNNPNVFGRGLFGAENQMVKTVYNWVGCVCRSESKTAVVRLIATFRAFDRLENGGFVHNCTNGTCRLGGCPVSTHGSLFPTSNNTLVDPRNTWNNWHRGT